MRRSLHRRSAPLLILAVLTATAWVIGSTNASAASSPVRVDAGATASYVDALGRTWSQDTGFTGGNRYSKPALVKGTPDPALYKNEHYGMSAWTAAVANGSYHVRLLEAETYFAAVGKRVFSVTAEGRTVARDVDIFAKVGGNRAYEIAFDVLVSDGQLDLGFSAKVNNPKASAVVVALNAPVTTTTAPPVTTTVPPVTTTTTPPSSTTTKLAWAPPALSNATTVNVSNANHNLNLDPAKDYVLTITSPVTAAGGLAVNGGHNVVLIGGLIDLAAWGAEPGKDNRGLYLKNWTGTMHIEGLHIAGLLGEGIDVDTRTPGATLQIENVRVETVQGSIDTNHADVIQNWGGPTTFRIDGLTGSTTYQGLFIQSTAFGEQTQLADLRRVNLHGDGADGRYLIYRTTGSVGQFNLYDVWMQPGSTWANERGAYPTADPAWSALHHGTPPGGDFVPAGIAGAAYVSPGYAS